MQAAQKPIQVKESAPDRPADMDNVNSKTDFGVTDCGLDVIGKGNP
jgi:hypothetical protein